MLLFGSLFYVTHTILLATYMAKVFIAFTQLPVTIVTAKARTFLRD